MKNILRFVTVFVGALIGSAFLHELGHAVAGWMQGVPVLPTPLKEYVLRDQIEWHQEMWIALGGVAGTVLVAVGTLIWHMRKDRIHGDAILAGVLLIPFAYTMRFLLVGRGHDGLEWQAAQSALGASPSGHAVDMMFLVVCLVAMVTWMVRSRGSLQASSLVKIAGLIVVGIALLIALQVVNNMLFDPFFPKTRTINLPRMLQHGSASEVGLFKLCGTRLINSPLALLRERDRG